MCLCFPRASKGQRNQNVRAIWFRIRAIALTGQTKIQRALDENPVAPIAIYQEGGKGRRSYSRIAMLWCPAENLDANIISKKLVTEVLELEIRGFREKSTIEIQFQGQPMNTDGFVELQWGLENSRSRSVYRTTFLVTAVEDPPFDVVLGRRYAITYGLSH